MVRTYLYIKESVNKDPSQLYISDVADVWGPLKQKLCGINIGELKECGAFAISSLDILRICSESSGSSDIGVLGSDKCVVIANPQGRRKPLTIIKAIISLLVMFAGGAVAIITYHMDAEMVKVIDSVQKFFTGNVTGNTLVVSIPYTVGIALGVLGFCGLFRKKKDITNPSMIELELYEHQKQIDNFSKEGGFWDDW